jgi:hypothetical protein
MRGWVTGGSWIVEGAGAEGYGARLRAQPRRGQPRRLASRRSLEHEVVVVVAAVLSAIGNRRIGREGGKARGQRCLETGVVIFLDMVGTVDQMRPQCGHAGVPEDAVVHGEQQVVDVARHAARAEACGRGAGRDDQHAAPAPEIALAVAQRPLGIGRIGYAIGPARRQHAIEPALEDRRHREPPERELNQHGVGPHEFFLLSRHVGHLRTALEGAEGGCGIRQPCTGLRIGEVAAVGHRLPAHGVEVRLAHLVPGGLERPDAGVPQGAIERASLGMRKNP